MYVSGRLLLSLVVVLTLACTVVSFRPSRAHTSTRSPSSLGATTQRPVANPTNPIETLQSIIKPLVEPVQFITANNVRAQYISAMLLRFGYFLGQGVTLSLTGFDKSAAEQKPIDTTAVINALRDALTTESIEELGAPTQEDLEGAAESELQRSLFSRNFASIATLLKKELEHIENGVYKFPYDLDPTDRYASSQWNPLRVASKFNTYVNDRKLVFERRDAKRGNEITEKFKGPKYPDYYLQNFHYQTDGWLSSKSAKLYDYQVESLFLGTADAMRRQVLPSVADFMKGKDPADVKVLDMATGTGRFASFLMDNYRSLDLTVMDLSPFYLEEAKRLLKRFETVKYVEAPCEVTPFEDNSFDAITCVYLFHELPMEIRKKVLAEMNRVLKPGGKLFFVDSAQSGEVPFERVLKGFTISAHEPYYLDYTKMDLNGAMSEAGFTVVDTGVHWVSKHVTAIKSSSVMSTPPTPTPSVASTTATPPVDTITSSVPVPPVSSPPRSYDPYNK